MRTLNLRIWFPVFIALLLGLVLLLWIGLQYRHLVERTQQQQLGLWRDTLSSLQVNVSHELLRGDVGEAQFLISQYALNPDLRVLAVIDHRGQVLLANHYEWRGQSAKKLPGYERLVYGHGSSESNFHLDIHLDDRGDNIHATLPVSLPGQADGLGNLQMGKIYFLFDLTRARQSVRDLLVADMSVMSPLLLLATLLVWLMFRHFVSRPLEVLRSASKKMSEGQFEPVDLKGKGELARLAQSFNEMARRISMEQHRLYDSEQRFRQLAENINEVFWLGSPDWRKVFYVSPAFEKYWGKSALALYRDPRLWLEIVHPDDREQVLADIPADLDAFGDCVNFREYRIQKPDGEVRWIKARAYPVRDADRKVVRVAGIAEDITQARNAEIVVRESAQRLAEAQRIAHVGSWELDLVNDTLWWSEETYCIFEINPQKKDITFETFLEAVHPDDRKKVATAYKISVENKTPYSIDHRLQMPDGRIKYIQELGRTLYDDAGNPLCSQGTVQDITDRVMMEEALRRSQKMEAIGQLSGGIAHDFNNQLGIVIGYLDFLKNEVANDEKSARWIDTASRATLRCMDLTRQLLTFSRKKGQEKTVVDLNVLLKDLETMVSRSVTPEIDVQYFLSDRLWKTEINAGEFEDAILNLVINARDAMPGGGKLLIETTNRRLDADYAVRNPGVTPGDYVQVMISDTGAGMDERTLERVFEPFFTTKPEGKGTGLGMAMVYGFANRYGGNVKVYSEIGVGTTVRLYLPCASGQEQFDDSDRVDTASLPGGSESVLIVDDEPDLLRLADQYLTRLGYRTFTAENIPGAMQILESDEPVDILFSDVVMPGGMNGYEFAQQATEKRPGIKVLLTSGYTSKTVAHNGLARFSAQLLNKPYRETDLARRIRSVLDESDAE